VGPAGTALPRAGRCGGARGAGPVLGGPGGRGPGAGWDRRRSGPSPRAPRRPALSGCG